MRGIFQKITAMISLKKFVRQVTNIIDELEDHKKPSGSSSSGSDGMSSRSNIPIQPSTGHGQPSGNNGCSYGTSAQQNAQLSNIKKDLDEIKGLMQGLLKTPLQQHLRGNSLSPSHQESLEQPPPHQYSLQLPYSTQLGKPQYLLQPTQA